MNKVVFLAQLLGALVFCIAATAIADPSQEEIRRIKRSIGDEAGTLKGQLKWGDIVLKARAIRVDGAKAIRESAAPAGPTPVQLHVDLDWAANFTSPVLDGLNKVMRGDVRSRPAEVTIAGRTVPIRNALLTEIGFPALDAAAKEPAYLAVKLAGEAQPPTGGGGPSRLSKSEVPLPSAPAPSESEVQKTWLPSNFRLIIGGLQTSRAKQLSQISLKPKAPQGNQRRSGETSLGDLVLPESDFKSSNLVKWEGPDWDASKNEISPRPSRIVYFDSNGRVLAVLKFRLVGLGRVKSLAGGNVQVGLRMDQFELSRN